jgi:type I restriction enzyme, S subunit
MSYPAYHKYKDSKIEWLGEIPWHWEVKKINYACLLKSGVSITSENINESGEFPVYGGHGLRGYCKNYTHDGSYVLIGRQGALCGNINYGHGKFWASEHAIVVYHKSNIQYLWLGETLRAMNLNQYSVSAAQPGLAVSNISCLKIPMPPFEEQKQIATFLDQETAKIDALIEKQKKLIELLKEKHQAVISHAVTKGLNPNAEMKDSGVDWLGKIPEHWVVNRVKNIFEIKKRIAGQEGYKVLSITQKGIKVKDIESGEGQLSMDYSKYQFVEVGDFAMNHMDLLTGFVDISEFHGVTSPDYRVFILKSKPNLAAYYLYIFQMGYNEKIFYSLGQGSSHIGRWRLATEEFNNFCVPCPQIDEQKKIVDFVHSQLMKIDVLTDKTKAAIDLLKERRTALISAAVTGKIDVRHFAHDEPKITLSQNACL